MVDPGINGYLVRPKDTDDLARAMLEMVDNPNKVREMAEASRRMVVERFSDERVIEQTIDTYGPAVILV